MLGFDNPRPSPRVGLYESRCPNGPQPKPPLEREEPVSVLGNGTSVFARDVLKMLTVKLLVPRRAEAPRRRRIPIRNNSKVIAETVATGQGKMCPRREGERYKQRADGSENPLLRVISARCNKEYA